MDSVKCDMYNIAGNCEESQLMRELTDLQCDNMCTKKSVLNTVVTGIFGTNDTNNGGSIEEESNVLTYIAIGFGIFIGLIFVIIGMISM